MQSFHHKPIKRFYLDGIIHDDSVMAKLRAEYSKLLLKEMRLSGYVPRLDIDQDFTISYNEEKQYFEFELSIHGVYTGRKQSKWIIGVDGIRPIYIRPNKLKEYSQEQA